MRIIVAAIVGREAGQKTTAPTIAAAAVGIVAVAIVSAAEAAVIVVVAEVAVVLVVSQDFDFDVRFVALIDHNSYTGCPNKL